MQQPFALLELPVPALKPVLKRMPPKESLNLAQNSKRMQSLMRHGKTRDTKLMITVHILCVKIELVSSLGSHLILVRGHDNSVPYRIHDYNASSLDLTTLAKSRWVVSFDNVLNGMYLVASWLGAMFDCSIGGLFWTRPCQKAFVEVTNWIKTRQTSIDSLTINCVGIENLNRLGVTGSLSVNQSVLQSELLDPALQEVYLQDGQFLVIPNLLAVNNLQKVQINKYLFTNEHIEQFVKKWMNGGFPKLEYAIWKSEEINENTDILDMQVPIGEGHSEPNRWFNSIQININNGSNIASKSGANAKLFVCPSENLFFLYVIE